MTTMLRLYLLVTLAMAGACFDTTKPEGDAGRADAAPVAGSMGSDPNDVDSDCDGRLDEDLPEPGGCQRLCAPHEYCSVGECRPRACVTDKDCAADRRCAIGCGCIPR